MNLSAIVYLTLLVVGIACTVWFAFSGGVLQGWYRELMNMWHALSQYWR
jgi:hypothetical protein